MLYALEIGSLIDWKMRSSRNRMPEGGADQFSLIDWKMRSSRNWAVAWACASRSLIDWKMRSSRNGEIVFSEPPLEFNRLENAL